MLLLCLLCACRGEKTESIQAPMDFRAALLRAGGCRFRAEGTVEQADKSLDFTLDCLCRADGTAELTILAPESVAGITAAVTAAGGALEYQDVRVGLGAGTDDRLTPLLAPVTLTEAWCRGWLTSAGEEDGALCAVFELEPGQDPLTVYTWFSPAGVPLRAELVRGGVAALRLRLSEFEWIHGGTNEAAEENLG